MTKPLLILLLASISSLSSAPVFAEITPLSINDVQRKPLQRAHLRPVTGLGLLADDRLVSGSEDGALVLWRRSDGKRMRLMTMHDGGITGLSVSKDTQSFAAFGADQQMSIWATNRSKDEVKAIRRFGPVDVLSTIVVNEFMKPMSFTASGHQQITWLSARSPKVTVLTIQLGELSQRASNHAALSIGVLMKPNGDPIDYATLHDDSVVRIWRISDKRNSPHRREFSIPIDDPVFLLTSSPQTIIVANYSGDLCVYSSPEDKSPVQQNIGDVNQLVCSPNGERLVAATENQLRFISLKDDKVKAKKTLVWPNPITAMSMSDEIAVFGDTAGTIAMIAWADMEHVTLCHDEASLKNDDVTRRREIAKAKTREKEELHLQNRLTSTEKRGQENAKRETDRIVAARNLEYKLQELQRERQIQFEKWQNPFGTLCSRCRRSVSINSGAGQRCPFCGAYWSGVRSR